jgi:hypothetical protein
MLIRQTMRQRRQAKLLEVKLELRRRMHDPIPEQGLYLRAVGEPLGDAARTDSRRGNAWNASSLVGFLWPGSVTRLLSNGSSDLAFLPKAGAQCVSSARWDLCGGRRATGVPTAISPHRSDAAERVRSWKPAKGPQRGLTLTNSGGWEW